MNKDELFKLSELKKLLWNLAEKVGTSETEQTKENWKNQVSLRQSKTTPGKSADENFEQCRTKIKFYEIFEEVQKLPYNYRKSLLETNRIVSLMIQASTDYSWLTRLSKFLVTIQLNKSPTYIHDSKYKGGFL